MFAPDRRALMAALTGIAATSIAPRSLAKAPAMTLFERIKRPIGLQLYTLGDAPGRDLDGVLAKLAALGIRDLQLPNMLGKSAPELAAAATRAGVTFSCIHLSPLVFPGATGLNFNSSTQEIVDALGAMGITNAVMPICPMPEGFAPKEGESVPVMLARAFSMAGVDHWKRTAAMLNAKAAALSPHGITLGYHNHNVEFAPLGRTTGWQIMVQETDSNLVPFEIDLGWVSAAGMDPAAFLLRHTGRVRWVHVKDVKASTKTNFALSMDPSEIGSGRLNWRRILTAAHKAGVQHFYIEQEPPFSIPRMEAVEKSYGYLSNLV